MEDELNLETNVDINEENLKEMESKYGKIPEQFLNNEVENETSK